MIHRQVQSQLYAYTYNNKLAYLQRGRHRTLAKLAKDF